MSPSPLSSGSVTSGAVLWVNLLIVWIVWGSTYIGILLATETIPPFLGMGSRFLVAFLIMLVLTGLLRGWSALRVTRREFASASFMGVALLGVGIGTVGLAQDYVPTGVMALIIASTPLTIVMWRVITRDRPSLLTSWVSSSASPGSAGCCCPEAPDPSRARMPTSSSGA